MTFQSLSSVSKRVSKVEKELGVTLFERAGRQNTFQLTKEGEVAIPYLEKMVDTYGDIIGTASEMRGSMGTLLSVGYPPISGTLGETEIISSFRADHPEISVNHVIMFSAELCRRVCAGELHCAFLLMPDEDLENPEIIKRILQADVEMITVSRHTDVYVGLSKNHPLAGEASIPVSLLKDEEFIYNNIPRHHGPDLGYIARSLPVQMLREGIRIRYMDFMNYSMVAEYVAAGYGVVPVACMPPAGRDDIVYVRLENATFPVSNVFVYPGHDAAPAVREFEAYVRDYAERGGRS